ncbi:MAG: RNA-directed DNA polymerase, partial [Geminicoccaceae bacterium]
DPIKETGAWIARVLKGHLNYFAVSGNDPSLWWFFTQVRWYWLRSLRRRSQKARISWEKYTRLVDRFFPPIRILHPQPIHRFDARTQGRSPVR